MKPKSVNMMMKVVEMAWLAVSAVCVVEVYMSWQPNRQRAYIFLAILAVAVFMYIFRKKQRINYIRKHQDNT